MAVQTCSGELTGPDDVGAAKQRLLEYASRHDAARARRRSPLLTGVLVGAGAVAVLRLAAGGRRGPGLLRTAVRAAALAKLAAPLVPVLVARLKAKARARSDGQSPNGARLHRRGTPAPIPAP